jgi:hypothetical protein
VTVNRTAVSPKPTRRRFQKTTRDKESSVVYRENGSETNQQRPFPARIEINFRKPSFNESRKKEKKHNNFSDSEK